MSDDTPRFPASIDSTGTSMASLHLIQQLIKLLIKKGVITHEEVCSGILADYNEQIAITDQTGSPGNANIAAALRVVLIQLQCPDVPGLE